MVEDRKRKQAVRARMAQTGESYTIAARRLAEEARHSDGREPDEPREAQ